MTGERCLIVAEVGQNHDGSVGFAHAYIDAIAQTGADGVKFQTHLADWESSVDEPWRARFGYDRTRRDYWKRIEFTPSQWRELAEHAGQCGLKFLSTPFSLQACDLLEEVGVHAWKIASGEITNLALLERVARTGQTVWLSTGMSPLSEIDWAVQVLRSCAPGELELVVFQCTSEYPCPPEHMGFNLLSEFRQRYGTPVGLSDHSGQIAAGITAAAYGAAVIEVHVCLSRHDFGPDIRSSLTMEDLTCLVKGVRFTEAARSSSFDKDAAAQGLESLRATFMKSIHAADALSAGTVLSREHLTFLKPASGIPASQYPAIVGRRLRRSLEAGARLSPDDLGERP